MTEPQDRLCSRYQSANRSRYPQGEPVTLYETLARIRDEGDTGPGTTEYRRLLDDEGEERAKAWRLKHAPAATLSARFYGPRTVEGKWTHTGAVVLDYDRIAPDQVEALKIASSAVRGPGDAPHAIACFASHSGKGVKVVVHVSPVPKSWEQHVEAWETARALYDGVLDVQADELADVTRLTFLPYDEAAIIRASGETYALRMKYKAADPPRAPAPAPAPAAPAPPEGRRCTKCGNHEYEHYLRRVPGAWRICRISPTGGRPALCFEVPDSLDMRSAWEGAMKAG